MDQLEQLNLQPEAKVRERTTQLEHTNQELVRANAEFMQLERDPENPQYIINERGYGYRFAG
ncbi:MAG: hypothetical protein Kow0047_15230 [Anaerolineae bacterium]